MGAGGGLGASASISGFMSVPTSAPHLLARWWLSMSTENPGDSKPSFPSPPTGLSLVTKPPTLRAFMYSSSSARNSSSVESERVVRRVPIAKSWAEREAEVRVPDFWAVGQPMGAWPVHVRCVQQLCRVNQVDRRNPGPVHVLALPERAVPHWRPFSSGLVAHALHHHEPTRAGAQHEVAYVLCGLPPVDILPPLAPRSLGWLFLQIDREQVPARAQLAGQLPPARVDGCRRNFGDELAVLHVANAVVPEPQI
eukprot:2218895-Prymnesium_polylepis.2